MCCKRTKKIELVKVGQGGYELPAFDISDYKKVRKERMFRDEIMRVGDVE